MRFIDGLCPETIHLLRTLQHNSKHHRVRQRALCMILSHQRYTPSQLAEMFDVNLKTIYNWFFAFEQRKLPGLYDRLGRGRKPTLTDSQQHQVEQWAKASPKNLKKAVAQMKQAFDKTVSQKTIERVIKRLSFTFRRCRKGPAKTPDPNDFQQKEAELQRLKIKHDAGIIELAYLDESGFCLEASVPYAWQKKGETIVIGTQKSRRLNVLGILDADGGLNAYTFECSIDTAVVVACIDDFCAELNRPTILVVDNASIDTSEAFEDRIAHWQARGLSIFRLPLYSPHLNLVEIVWRFIKYQWVEFWAYLSFEHLVKYVEHVLANWGTKYQINFV